VTARSILRLQQFRFGEYSAEIDALLRDEMLPAVLGHDGLLDLFVARQDRAGGDSRVIVSVWESLDAMDAILGQDPLARLKVRRPGGIENLRVEILPLAIELHLDRAEWPSILRVYHGLARPGELDAYVGEVRSGAIADAAVNAGLTGLYLATDPPDRFVTVSAWSGWAAIEQATGSNIARPNATRRTPHLLAGDATHYEILPGTMRPVARAAEAPQPAYRPETAAAPA
jgi:heme-degrading monooxygenase HmoA